MDPMKWLLLVPVVFVIFLLALFFFGLLQPAKHSATVSLHLKQKPENVFAALDKIEDRFASVAKAEPMADRNGRPAMRYTVNWGRRRITLTQLERTPPARLVIRMARSDGMVWGTWTYAIAGEDGGCRIVLSEDGELKNPFFRALARMRGLDTHIAQNLRELAAQFGEPARVERGAAPNP